MNPTSSFAMLIRGGLMLCCLLLVPTTAMLGPTIAESIFKKEDTSIDLTPAPLAAALPSESRSWSQSLATLQAPRPGGGMPTALSHAAGIPQPANGVPGLAEDGSQVPGPQAAIYQIPVSGQGSLPQTANPQPALGAQYHVEPATAPAVADITADGLLAVPRPDPFRGMQHRLQELGANYYLLETGGPDGNSFRFHCKMPVAGSPHQTRGFEAVASDPLQAMQQVLEHVEQWHRAGGRF